MALLSVTALLAEPAVADPPRRVWRDWALVVVVVGLVVVEGVVRSDDPGQPVTTIVIATLAVVLLSRRSHPLATTAVGFATVMALDQATLVATGAPLEFFSAAAVLVLPYSLFRWGSGRHIAIGVAVLVTSFTVSVVTDWTGVGDSVGGGIVLAFPALLGAQVRHLVGSRERTVEQARSHERTQLARELHDTVAHHVSAIAVQAQAGRIAGASDPQVAIDALRVIEGEASRTLAEMRTIVGALRADEHADYAPQAGVDQIESLSLSPGDPPVTVVGAASAAGVRPAVGTALHRIAQEAVTNARRHARNATGVTVRLGVDARRVRLTVLDDGDILPSGSVRPAGFGLIGMEERAHLLGGTLEAGPVVPHGWRVDATIPLGGD